MDTVENVLGRLASPRETLVLTGAGISVDAPAGLPAGNGYTRRALEHCCDQVHPDQVGRLFEATGMPGGFPRFETVLTVVAHCYGSAGLRDLVSDMVTIEPNDLHTFFAQHLAACGRHVTANIDPGIERAAGPGLAEQMARQLLHVHGLATPGSDLTRLGITLPLIEHGLQPDVQHRLDSWLRDCDSLLVTGYSGLDYFDVDPYLASLAPDLLAGKLVVWVNHDHADPDLRIETGLDIPALHLMRAAGAEVVVVRGATRQVLDLLAQSWHLERVPHVAPQLEKDPWLPDPSVWTATARRRATIELWAQLGCPEPLLEILRLDPDRVTAETAGAFADAAWHAGRYRAARSLWRQAYPTDALADRLLRAERSAACDWISGRYRRALRELIRLASAIEQTPDVPAHVRLQVADTLSRVWEQMQRLPDVRWRADQSVRDLAARILPDQDGRLSRDLQWRRETARSKLGDPEDPARIEITQAAGHDQASSSSVIRTLNYRHGELRALQEARMAGGERIDDAAWPQDYRELVSRFRVVGAWGDAARVFLLPRAMKVWPLRAPVEMFRPRVELALYHRFRMAAGVVAQEALFQLRRFRPRLSRLIDHTVGMLRLRERRQEPPRRLLGQRLVERLRTQRDKSRG